MVALRITAIGDFMKKLLCSDTFDHFLLQESSITGAVSYQINGMLHRDFYSSEELEAEGLSGCSFIPFGRVRTQCFDLFKGKRTPSSFKFVFLLSPEHMENTLKQTGTAYTANDVSAILFNLHFQNGLLRLTTGISYRTFSADKSLEREWDSLMKRFLREKGIAFEEL